MSLGNSLTSIGDCAFEYCSFRSVTIPNSLTNIGESAFAACRDLTSVTVPNSVASLGRYAFHSCASLTNVILGNNIIIIAEQTFYGCSGLSSVTIPNSVTNIGYAAFRNCTRLASIMIGTNVTSIANEAFRDCTSLQGVYFLGSAPSIGSWVFLGDNYVTVYYRLGATGWSPTFGGRPTALWEPLVPYNYTINNNTITIAQYTGSDGEVAIPSTINGLPVTSIGDNAFYRCAILTSLTIPNSVTSIGSYAFWSCTGLTNVTIPGSTTNIGDGTFSGCANLRGITLDEFNSFYSSVDGVLFNKSQTSLIQYPGGRTGSYTVPNGVTSIGARAFSGCVGLTSVPRDKCIAILAGTSDDGPCLSADRCPPSS